MAASQAAGIAVATALRVYSAQNTTIAYTRNPQCWLNGADLTGLSPWNSTHGYQSSLTPPAKDIVIGANHFFPDNGATAVWVTANNEVVTRTLTASVEIGFSDIRVGKLDSDLPDDIALYPVLPANWTQYLPTASLTPPPPGARIPMIIFDQEEKALVFDLYGIASESEVYAMPLDATRQLFFESLVGGDSGNPGFFLIGGQLVLAFTNYTTTASPFLSDFVNEINAAMGTLGSAYRLAHPTLHFNTY